MGETVEKGIRNSKRMIRMDERAKNCIMKPKRMMKMGTTGGQEPNNSNHNG